MIWAAMRVNLSSVFAKNKGADKPAHPRRLISTFVIHLLEQIITRLATSEILIFYNGLCILRDWFKSRFVRSPIRGFSRRGPIMIYFYISCRPVICDYGISWSHSRVSSAGKGCRLDNRQDNLAIDIYIQS